jgi:hypothetical protein
MQVFCTFFTHSHGIVRLRSLIFANYSQYYEQILRLSYNPKPVYRRL